MSLNDLAGAKIQELIDINCQLRFYLQNNWGLEAQGHSHYKWACEPLGLEANIWVNSGGTFEFKLVALVIEAGELSAKELDHRTCEFTRAMIDDCMGEVENAIELCQVLVC